MIGTRRPLRHRPQRAAPDRLPDRRADLGRRRDVAPEPAHLARGLCRPALRLDDLLRQLRLRAELARRASTSRSTTASPASAALMTDRWPGCRPSSPRSATRSSGDIGGCVASLAGRQLPRRRARLARLGGVPQPRRRRPRYGVDLGPHARPGSASATTGASSSPRRARCSPRPTAWSTRPVWGAVYASTKLDAALEPDFNATDADWFDSGFAGNGDRAVGYSASLAYYRADHRRPQRHRRRRHRRHHPQDTFPTSCPPRPCSACATRSDAHGDCEMFDDFYGLTGKPFQLTPDPAFYFRSVTHRKALSLPRLRPGAGRGLHRHHRRGRRGQVDARRAPDGHDRPAAADRRPDRHQQARRRGDRPRRRAELRARQSTGTTRPARSARSRASCTSKRAPGGAAC